MILEQTLGESVILPLNTIVFSLSHTDIEGSRSGLVRDRKTFLLTRYGSGSIDGGAFTVRDVNKLVQ